MKASRLIDMLQNLHGDTEIEILIPGDDEGMPIKEIEVEGDLTAFLIADC